MDTDTFALATQTLHPVKLDHPELIDLMKQAYSAEKAAAYAYQGHAASVKKPEEKIAIRQIEEDEWSHRQQVLEMMNYYNILPSRGYEIRFAIIGRVISASCHVIGWFMPYFFAGKLESGNVCEYFRMKRFFNGLGIHQWDVILYEMGMKEKEHEVYFLQKSEESKLLPFFERIFKWGSHNSKNNIDLDKKYPVEESGQYCKK